MYITTVEFGGGGYPENVSFMQFPQNSDGFRQNEGLWNSYNSVF